VSLLTLSDPDSVYEDPEDEYVLPPEYNGDGRIFGYTTVNGVPQKLGVALMHNRNKIVDTMFSRASDGWFEFKNLNRNTSYTLMVRDPTGHFNDEYRYNVSPVL
jgi:hypothetical protein